MAPRESTIRRVLKRVDASALEAAWRSWALAQLDAQPAPTGTSRREQRRMLAVDGKTLRGAHVRVADGSVGLPHADPGLFARLIHGHWSIENRLHRVRDVTFDEDRAIARTGHAPQAMSALRNFAITALRLSGATNIAAALRHRARNLLRPLITYKIT